MMLGQLRVSIVGAQTQVNGKNKKPYTVYRTAVNFRGQCYQRLIRYSQFQRFHKKLHLRDAAAKRAIVFPHKEWSRSVSLQDDVVEARQVLLDEYMDNVTSHELTHGCFDRLLRLLKVGDYDPEPTLQSHGSPTKMPFGSASPSQRQIDAVEPLTAAGAAATTASSSSSDEHGGKREQQRRGLGSGVNPAPSATGATDHIGNNMTREQSSAAAGTTLHTQPSTTETDQTTDDERMDDVDDDQRLMTSSSTINSDDYVPTDDDEHDDRTSNHSDPIDVHATLTDANASSTQPSVLRASESAPVRRPKKVKFHVRTSEGHANGVVHSAPTTHARSSATLSPERKYRSRIEKQMSNIEDMLERYPPVDHVPKKFTLQATQTESQAERSRSESL